MRRLRTWLVYQLDALARRVAPRPKSRERAEQMVLLYKATNYPAPDPQVLAQLLDGLIATDEPPQRSS